MKRVAWGAWTLAAVVAASTVAGPPALPATAPGALPLARGWGRLVASGVLTAVDQAARTVTFVISGAGRLETFEGGTAWRPATVSGTRTVHLLPATVLVDADAYPVSSPAVRPGAPAAVWAAVRPDAGILALTLELTALRREAVGVRFQGIGVAAAGVVLRRSGSTLTLLTPPGVLRSVVLTAATVVRRGAESVPVSALGPYDVLRVGGLVNSDGSLVATSVDVEFTAASGAQVSGPVELNVGGLGGLVIGGTLVSTSADTYVVRGGARGAVAGVTPGVPAVAYGIPIMAGGTPVGLAARVVVIH